VVGDFNTPLSPTDKSSRQKFYRETLEFKDTIDLKELTDVYRVFHPTTAQYTFFSASHRTFSKIDHIVGHKASLNKFKKTEITHCILSDHNAIKLEFSNNRNSRKYSNTWRLNNMGEKQNILGI
jgi:exonuclease III